MSPSKNASALREEIFAARRNAVFIGDTTPNGTPMPSFSEDKYVDTLMALIDREKKQAVEEAIQVINDKYGGCDDFYIWEKESSYIFSHMFPPHS